MKKSVLRISLLVLIVGMASFTWYTQQQPYSKEHLMEPADLAKILNTPGSLKPVIFNVGAMPLIKNAQSIGMGYSEEALNTLKEKLTKVGKDETIVIYCGCCTMENCPNIKKPYEYLISAGYKNSKILHIQKDLGHDWQDKGYPMHQP